MSQPYHAPELFSRSLAIVSPPSQNVFRSISIRYLLHSPLRKTLRKPLLNRIPPDQLTSIVMKSVTFITLSAVAFAITIAHQSGHHASDSRKKINLRHNFLTGETGRRTGTNQNSQAATATGGILLQDIYSLEKMRRFNLERTAERVVHGRGAGAHGVFTSTVDFSKYTQARVFHGGNRKTEIFVRFSTVIHGRDSPETLRDPRGFAIKFKTVDGNFDLVGNNLPVFFIRDYIKFPDMVHSLKPDPITNRQDPNRFFDFFSALGGMATHMLTYIYSDLGIPKSYRFIEGNSVHAYKLVSRGKVTYCKFRWFPEQGVRNLTMEEAAKIQGMDFSHATRDLYDAIEAGKFPRWRLAVQLLDPKLLNSFDFDALDATKEWPTSIPFQTLGYFELNRVPVNFFQFTEQSAFSPGNFLAGAIEPSEDRLLQGRLISYHESQSYRIGSSNVNMLPVNRPNAPVNNYNQDGVMNFGNNWAGSINYEPSNDPNAYREDPASFMSRADICGSTQQAPIKKTLNFRQAGERYRRFDASQQMNLIKNLAGDLKQVRSDKVRCTMAAHFYKADPRYGSRVSNAVRCPLPVVRLIAGKLRE